VNPSSHRPKPALCVLAKGPMCSITKPNTCNMLVAWSWDRVRAGQTLRNRELKALDLFKVRGGN